MFTSTAGSQTDGLMHVVAKGNSSWLILRKRGRESREAEWIAWHFAYSLLCFKNNPHPPRFKHEGGAGGCKRARERERFHAYYSTLSRQRPPARQLFLASPQTIFSPLPLFQAFIRKKRLHQMKETDGGGCFGGGAASFWPPHKLVFMWWVHYMLPITLERDRHVVTKSGRIKRKIWANISQFYALGFLCRCRFLCVRTNAFLFDASSPNRGGESGA